MKYTVLLLQPDWFADDACCAADTVDRIWVEAESVEEAMIRATEKAPLERIEEPYPDEDEEEFEERRQDYMDGLAVLAVYEGHLFDLYVC